MSFKRKYLGKSKKKSPRVIAVKGTIIVFVLAFVFGVICWYVGHYVFRQGTVHTFGDFIGGFFGFLIVASFAFYPYVWLYKKAWNEKQRIYWRSPGGIAVMGSIIISTLTIIFGILEPPNWVMAGRWGWNFIFYFFFFFSFGGWIFYLCVGIYWSCLQKRYHMIKLLKKIEGYPDTTQIYIPKIAKDYGIEKMELLKTIERYIAREYLSGRIDYRTLDYIYVPRGKTEDKGLEKYILTIDIHEKFYESLFYDPKISPFRQKQTVKVHIINNVRDTLSKFIISSNARSRGLNDDT